jgi:hypothetical protein
MTRIDWPYWWDDRMIQSTIDGTRGDQCAYKTDQKYFAINGTVFLCTNKMRALREYLNTRREIHPGWYGYENHGSIRPDSHYTAAARRNWNLKYAGNVKDEWIDHTTTHQYHH